MDKYNFIKDSKRELEAFYARFFDSDDELQTFLSDAFDYENGSLARRQALFQVQRFISLANDIDKIRPGRDPLRILFLKIVLMRYALFQVIQTKQSPFSIRNSVIVLV